MNILVSFSGRSSTLANLPFAYKSDSMVLKVLSMRLSRVLNFAVFFNCEATAFCNSTNAACKCTSYVFFVTISNFHTYIRKKKNSKLESQTTVKDFKRI
ncbi:hypothetical protein HanIR_Chr15g0776111 [Helianthus annuus]|nr:hypothetical protein HanIR_Chr15g0776111 [Helianthus annuus]